ncbi:MAG TPA: flagellar biosynthetic protein FliO [Rhodanobacter sp.]|nr:flagellar biosynthetic protein FliO [Rhodanobacter sp.]
MIIVADMLASAPAAAAEFNAPGELLRVLLSLAGIVVLIFAAGWLSRRLQRARGTGGRRIRCVESFAIGARERIVLLEADGTRLLIGTGPGGMRTLHVYDHVAAAPPGVVAAQPVAMPAFGELLARWKRRA